MNPFGFAWMERYQPSTTDSYGSYRDPVATMPREATPFSVDATLIPTPMEFASLCLLAATLLAIAWLWLRREFRR